MALILINVGVPKNKLAGSSGCIGSSRNTQDDHLFRSAAPGNPPGLKIQQFDQDQGG
jgi:hypothetical protein